MKTIVGLGTAIESVLKGEIKRASRITEDGNELILKNQAGNLHISLRQGGGFETFASRAVLHENDAHAEWEVEYELDHQPFQIICVRYKAKPHRGHAKNEIKHEYSSTLAMVRKKYPDRSDFERFLSIVGFNDGKVTVLYAEEAE